MNVQKETAEGQKNEHKSVTFVSLLCPGVILLHFSFRTSTCSQFRLQFRTCSVGRANAPFKKVGIFASVKVASSRTVYSRKVSMEQECRYRCTAKWRISGLKCIKTQQMDGAAYTPDFIKMFWSTYGTSTKMNIGRRYDNSVSMSEPTQLVVR